MGNLKVIISDAVERRFRRVAMKRYGNSKGALSEAAEAALNDWSTKEDNDDGEVNILPGFEQDPVGAIEGLLKNVRAKSVELQHEARRIRVKKSSVKTTD
jgi:hypothetical protein